MADGVCGGACAPAACGKGKKGEGNERIGQTGPVPEKGLARYCGQGRKVGKGTKMALIGGGRCTCPIGCGEVPVLSPVGIEIGD